MENQVLALLAASFPQDDKATVVRIKSLAGCPLHEQLSGLTAIERTPGLRVDLFGLVAAAKMALANEEQYLETFAEKALRIQGAL